MTAAEYIASLDLSRRCMTQSEKAKLSRIERAEKIARLGIDAVKTADVALRTKSPESIEKNNRFARSQAGARQAIIDRMHGRIDRSSFAQSEPAEPDLSAAFTYGNEVYGGE